MHGTTLKLRLEPEQNAGGVGAIVDIQYRRAPVRITGYGRIYEGCEVDWSFRPFQTSEDGQKEIPAGRLLPQVAERLGVKEILAPSPEFGRKCAKASDLRTSIMLKHGTARVVLRRGYRADICVLYPGQTYGISAAGCPVPWIYAPGTNPRVVVAHGGLKCLIDFDRTLAGQRPRPPASVIDCMWEALGHPNPKDVTAGFAFPIAPASYRHPWNDPTHPHNQQLCEALVAAYGPESVLGWRDANPAVHKQGCIDLGHIIRAQFKRLGIPSTRIHGAAASDALGDDRLPLWYDTRGLHGKDARNLILVTHRG